MDNAPRVSVQRTPGGLTMAPAVMEFSVSEKSKREAKVHFGEGAETSRRGACTPKMT
jgi:hypothetical protein